MTLQERRDNISPWDSEQWKQHRSANRIKSIFPLKGPQIVRKEEIKKSWWKKLLDFFKKIIYN